MNETLKTIRARRSVRKFTDEPVPREVIEQIVDAGIWAASGKNGQAPIVIAITNPELVARLSDMNRRVGGWPEGFWDLYGSIGDGSLEVPPDAPPSDDAEFEVLFA